MRDLFQVIQTVRLSEKATFLLEENNDYVFKVHRDSNKLEIKRAVERLFKTKVASVRTCNYRGKKKRERRADFGRTAHWKKAFVKLKEGEHIELI